MRDPEEGEDLSREIRMYKRALNPLNGFSFGSFTQVLNRSINLPYLGHTKRMRWFTSSTKVSLLACLIERARGMLNNPILLERGSRRAQS